MTNNILRTQENPDKSGEWVEIYMTDEEWAAAYHPVNPDLQIVRDKITQKIADEINRQEDFDQARVTKANAALASIATDFTEVTADALIAPGATAAQIRDIVARLLIREKKALQREQTLIKVIMRLVEQVK